MHAPAQPPCHEAVEQRAAHPAPCEGVCHHAADRDGMLRHETHVRLEIILHDVLHADARLQVEPAYAQKVARGGRPHNDAARLPPFMKKLERADRNRHTQV